MYNSASFTSVATSIKQHHDSSSSLFVSLLLIKNEIKKKLIKNGPAVIAHGISTAPASLHHRLLHALTKLKKNPA